MILVTGGAGFIGSHVVDALLAEGTRPVVLDDLSSGDPSNLPDGVEVVEADVADPDVADLIAHLGPEAVIHAAAQVSVASSMMDPNLDLNANVLGTANVLAGARAAGSRRFVFLSSGGGVYGESDGADETTLPGPRATTARTSTSRSVTWSSAASRTPSPGSPTCTARASAPTSKAGWSPSSWRGSPRGCRSR